MPSLLQLLPPSLLLALVGAQAPAFYHTGCRDGAPQVEDGIEPKAEGGGVAAPPKKGKRRKYGRQIRGSPRPVRVS